MSDYYFQLDKLSVGYDGKALIHDINIGIHKGEIITLIGPNGSGKSTILKSITKQLEIVHGDVVFQEMNIKKISYKQLAARMAVVLTERMRPELMTCRDIVATGRYPYTGSLGILSLEDEQKVDEAIAAVHAEEVADRDFNNISDGQRQRILLARAICQEPEVMILDEPTSFLDIKHKLELLSILRGMAKQKGITVIMSLHEIDLAQKISDRIICVHGDTIYGFGRPDEIFEEERIRDLYGIDNGYFDTTFGSIELPKVEGQPRVLVLSAGGSGVPVYRHLQKQEIPFAAGILYENDVDLQLARLLAGQIVTERAFSPISDGAYEEACRIMDQVDQVVDAGFPLGEQNHRMGDLLSRAEAAGKLIRLGSAGSEEDLQKLRRLGER